MQEVATKVVKVMAFSYFDNAFLIYFFMNANTNYTNNNRKIKLSPNRIVY